ncbi:MAG TPA: TetR/AcrR family transcriptional regulator [Bryobacteraceae bacterium]|nr:TetR/AcrR family transcriptional regulator [Bryobacteraceae bacterium]
MNYAVPVAVPDTKERILDTAERLFGEHGFGSTSLRAITAAAGVNLAAVNYHFQTKDSLVHAVIQRRMAPINAHRLELLDACEKSAGDGPLSLEKIIEAFLLPVIAARRNELEHFGPILARLYTEPKEFSLRMFEQHIRPVSSRFIAAFHRALPGLPEEDLLWRLHFAVGTITHIVGAPHILRANSGGRCDPSNIPIVLSQLCAFIKGGFHAPLAEKHS